MSDAIHHPAHTLPPISRLALQEEVIGLLDPARNVTMATIHREVRAAIALGRQHDRAEPPAPHIFRVGLSLAYHDARGIDAYFILRVNDDLSISIKTNLPNYSEVEPEGTGHQAPGTSGGAA